MRSVVCAVVFVLLGWSRGYSQCNWSVAKAADPRHIYYAIQFIDSVHGWLGRTHDTTDDQGLRTTDGGRTWTPMIFPHLAAAGYCFSFLDSLNGWAMLSGENSICHTSDGGITWTLVYSIPYKDLGYDIIQFVDQFHGFAVGSDTTGTTTATRRTTNGGQTWSSTAISNAHAELAMQFVNPRLGWIAGQQIFVTTDGGASWSEQTYDRATLYKITGIDFVDSLEGWGCGYNQGYVIHTSDGGLHWATETRVDSTIDVTGVAIKFVNHRVGWVFGYAFYQGDVREVIYQTIDGGTHWTRESIGLAPAVYKASTVDMCHSWLLCVDGSVLASETPSAVRPPTLLVPETVSLYQNFPNPANPSTTIIYSLPRRGRVVIRLFDGLGREVRTLVDEEAEVGEHSMPVDLGGLSSGVYFYRLTTPKYDIARKMVVIK